MAQLGRVLATLAEGQSSVPNTYTVLVICLSDSVLHSFTSELVSVLAPQDALKTFSVCFFFLIFWWKRKSDPCFSKTHCMVMSSL